MNLVLSVFILTGVYGFTMSIFGSVGLSTAVTVGVASFSALMYTVPSFAGKVFNTVVIPDFTHKSAKEVLELGDAEYEAYIKAKAEYDKAVSKDQMQKLINEANENSASKEDISKLENTLKSKLEAIDEAFLSLKARLEKGGKGDVDKKLKDYIVENSKVLKAIKSGDKKAIQFAVKATQVASDINSGSDYAELVPGTVRKPVRAVRLLDLFRRKAVSTEYIKYREENVVTRDAKFVVACATSTHTTKKSWIVRTVELAKIRDIVDVCIDMLDDYDFVESEVRALINESVQLKAEYELLLGAAANPTDMLSIDSIASEFNPANVLAPFDGAGSNGFQDANIEQLADAMAAQITVFGEENKWMPDTFLMNYTDFIRFRNLKDADGNKLIKTMSDGTATLAGMTIITSPIVAANTCYVFDADQGEILDRQNITVKTSFENNDNIEHEIVTFVAVERLQFHVPLINRDAFMKCSDVAAAITAITNP